MMDPLPDFPGLFLSATRKSSGKTTITIGLAAVFTRIGYSVQTFKKGLDYIDPMWLSAASGQDCHNLDPFVMGNSGVVRNFQRHAAHSDLSLVEGNMGLFDGVDPEGSDCSAALAQQLKTPIILILDCQGLARGAAAHLLGHLQFPGGERIAGIILNNVAGARQNGKISAAIQRYCPDTPLLGSLPRAPEIMIHERHLGLVPPKEAHSLSERLTPIADHVAQHLNLNHLLQIAGLSSPPSTTTHSSARITTSPPPSLSTLRVGLALDNAFHFYYPENLNVLRGAGIQLIPFSPLRDAVFPKVDGLYLGGGFPEMFLEQLSANRSMLRQIQEAAEKGMPIYAECGGLMLLARQLVWQERSVEMANVLPFSVEMGRRPQGYGYMILQGTGATSWPGKNKIVRCHEFHYSRAIHLDSDREKISFAYRVQRGVGMDGDHDGLLYRNVFASYAHIHADGATGWAPFLAQFWKRGLLTELL